MRGMGSTAGGPRPAMLRARVALVASVALAACSAGGGGDVPLATVATTDFSSYLIQNGELRAVKTENITSPTWGKVADVVTEGSEVKEGEPVVWIETEEIEQEVKRLEFELDVAHTNLQKAEEQARTQKVEARLGLEEAEAQVAYRNIAWTRAEEARDARKSLFEEGLVSRADMQDAESAALEARLALETANVALDRARQQSESAKKTVVFDLANARANLEKNEKLHANARQRLDNAIIKATKGGIVVYKKNWRGEKLKIGDQVWVGAPLVEIPDLSHMEAVLQVNEVDISRVEKEQKATLEVEAIPGVELHGAVESVAGLAKELPGGKEGEPSGIRAFEVVVSITEAEERLKPGMTVVSRLLIHRQDEALTIPRLAVFERDGGRVAFVKQALGFERREIVVGAANDHEVVVEKGLTEGERVALLDPEGGSSGPAATPTGAAEPVPDVAVDHGPNDAVAPS